MEHLDAADELIALVDHSHRLAAELVAVADLAATHPAGQETASS